MKGKEAFLPKLRFPEFRNAGQWKEKQLDQVCEVNPKSERLPDKFIYIDLESVEAGTLLQKNVVCRDGAPSRAQRLLEYGDIIFQLVRPYQKNNFLFNERDGSSYVASTGYAQLRPHQSNIYLYQYLHTESFVEKVLSQCIGSNYPAISTGDLSKILVKMPKPEEQNKIAACLSSLDELIDAQARKLGDLGDYKKGLMQQFFPQEGETVPRLRFSEFRDAGEWKPKKLGQIGKFFGGGTPDTSAPEYWGGEILWFTPTELKERYLLKSKRTITVKGLNNSSAILLPRGALLISTRATIGDISIADNPCTTNQGLQSLVVHEDEVNLFWYYWLLRHRNELFRRSSGSTFLEINKTELKKIPVFRPCREEQQKVAAFLSSVDELIDVQVRGLDALRIHKKGLMQQLFPKVDEALP